MHTRNVWLVAMLSLLATSAVAETRTAQLKPQFLSPAELAHILGVREGDGRGVLAWQQTDGNHAVEVRRNDAANLLILMGSSEDVAAAEALARAADVAPRQIMVEAAIVEVDRDAALNAGVDWGSFNSSISFDQQHTRNAGFGVRKSSRDLLSLRAQMFDALRLLQESGAAKLRSAPRILTLNNHPATVLDGQRVTYITRYSSFTNLFETDTLDAGLTLSVTPSLGESGYLTLDVRAELTTLGSNISGSPIKDGQIVENTVVAKDGESILVGGFTRSVEQRRHRRFPGLGYVLPFVFSREIKVQSTRENFIVITPRVVDFTAAVDEPTRQRMEGK